MKTAALLTLLISASFVPAQVATSVRSIVPPGPYDWRDANTHALVTSIWYPTGASAHKLPLILLSHGNGGAGKSLAWLGQALAEHGYIAAAVNHPGNNFMDDYTIRGFTLWYLRASHLSRVLDALLIDPEFGPKIDPSRVGAVGFSLGGYTVLELAGGVGTYAAFKAFCESPAADALCRDQLEFPNLRTQAEKLAAGNVEYRNQLAASSASYADKRIRAAFLIAPALGPAFSEASLRHISIAVEIVAGKDDSVVPVTTNAMYFARYIPSAQLSLLPNGVNHYTFLPPCPPSAKAAYCFDAPGVDRDKVHLETSNKAMEFFGNHLSP